MQRIIDETTDGLIELGAASVQTQGDVLFAPEPGVGRPPMGLSED
uniref:Benenodin family lasso peptide n=1 Tax=Caulobacter sp. (strain K31) TaxID=366602 RepID=B0T9D8_CAUSK